MARTNYPPQADELMRQILARLAALEAAAQTRIPLNVITSGGLTIDGGDIDVLYGSIVIGVAGGSQIVISLTGGTPLTYYPTGRAAILNSSAMQTIIQGSGSAQYEQLQILAAEDNTQLDGIGSGWTSSSPDGTQAPQVIDFYHDPAGNYHFFRVMDYRGNTTTGQTTAVQPGTGTSRANVAVAETWHTTSLAATWSVPSGACEYRMQTDGTVMMAGQIKTTNTALASGAQVATLPAGYLPLQPWYGSAALVGSTGFVQVEVATSGAVTLIFSGTLNAPTISLDGIRFSTI